MNRKYTTTVNRGLWSEDEHNRFLEAIQIYQNGPWRYVAKHVGTRNIRQVHTHAQKYYEKVNRHLRGLRKERSFLVRPEHRIASLPTELHQPVIAEVEIQDDPVENNVGVNEDTSDTDDGGKSPNLEETELPSLEDSLDILLQWLEEEET